MNIIGDTGAASLSEALKSNMALTKLNLSGEDKRKKTHKRHLSTIHLYPFSFSLTGNKIGERGATSFSESLKSNTTLNALSLSCEYNRKNTHKRHPSTFHFFLSLHTKQGTALEKQEQHH